MKYSVSLHFGEGAIFTIEHNCCLWKNDDGSSLYFISSSEISLNEFTIDLSFDLVKAFLEKL
jgi:hypothetical protein